MTLVQAVILVGFATRGLIIGSAASGCALIALGQGAARCAARDSALAAAYCARGGTSRAGGAAARHCTLIALRQ